MNTEQLLEHADREHEAAMRRAAALAEALTGAPAPLMMRRACACCRALISPDRLAILPGTPHCTECSAAKSAAEEADAAWRDGIHYAGRITVTAE